MKHVIALSFVFSCGSAALAQAPAAQEPGAPEPARAAKPADLLRGDWLAVGPGTSVGTPAGGVEVRYERSGTRAFGAALPLPAGRLVGAEQLAVEFVGDAGAMLLVSLRREDGGVHSWPVVALTGAPLRVDLRIAELAWDRFQNAGRTAQPFDAADVRALSITDIGGFFGGATGPRSFTVTALGLGGGAVPSPAVARAGEAAFFAALVDGRGDAADAIAALRADVLREPSAARPQLLLGLAHLWLVAEGSRRDPAAIDHLLLADAWFSRARGLDPAETRLPSWHVPVRLALADVLERPGDAAPAWRELDAACEVDPGFHGFAVGLLGWSHADDAPRFRAGLAAVRRTLREADPSDPSVRNEPRWPHNREGFLLLAADYEQRVGERERAAALLDRIAAEPEFDSWPFREQVEQRRRAWADGGRPRGDGSWMQPHGCAVCHRAR